MIQFFAALVVLPLLIVVYAAMAVLLPACLILATLGAIARRV